MDINAIRKEIAAHLVKQGLLEKQSKFLKEMRSRWIVLTTNYLMCFRNQDCIDMTDMIDLKHVTTIKSHFAKTELGVGFKISSDDISLNFRCATTVEKWCWIVAVERAVELKQRGATPYNHSLLLRTKGFLSVDEYEGAESIIIDLHMLPQQVSTSPRTSFSKRLAQGEKTSRFTMMAKLAIQEPIALSTRRTKAKSQQIKRELLDQGTQTQSVIEAERQKYSLPLKKVSSLTMRPKYTQKKDINNSRFMISLFDRFDETSETELKQLILRLLIQITQSNLQLRDFLLCECKMHPNSKFVADWFIQAYTKDIESEDSLAEALGFLEFVLSNITDFFSYEQLQALKRLLTNSLTILKRETSLALVMSNIELVNCIDSYAMEEINGIIKIVTQLQKNSSNQKQFDKFLQDFHN